MKRYYCEVWTESKKGKVVEYEAVKPLIEALKEIRDSNIHAFTPAGSCIHVIAKKAIEGIE